jgi:uncharacterized RDD family membrane protein YckC
MYCTQCGVSVAEGAGFCSSCGAAVQIASDETIPVSIAVKPAAAQKNVPQVRPWVRYWARMFDILLFSFGVGLLGTDFLPQAFSETGSGETSFWIGLETSSGIGLLFVWVFVEALLLSTFGTTPGKWLFKVRVILPSGSAISYSTALSRSIKVWWRGLGIGLPIVSLITLIVAHGRLIDNGMTSWDREGGFLVTHETFGVMRIMLATLVFFTLILLSVYIGNNAQPEVFVPTTIKM